MAARGRRVLVQGPAGRIEGAASRGIALVAHPHPLFGGSLENKVTQSLARAFVELGYTAWRPNFRGVGGTDGVHAEGRGELEDLLAVLAHAGAERPVLAGFSFGAALAAQAAGRVAAERLVLVGVAVTRLAVPPVPPDTIVIHGAEDETVPLTDVLAWAKPQELPVVVIPGADHFFHRRLALLRDIVKGQWR
jgi:hypothetical protein